VEGNYIGLSAQGGYANRITNLGIDVESSHNRIGGTTPAARNVISHTGYGEGQFPLGTLDVTTDATGPAAFSFSILADLAGQYATATAQDTAGNTSEFSEARIVLPPQLFEHTSTTKMLDWIRFLKTTGSAGALVVGCLGNPLYAAEWTVSSPNGAIRAPSCWTRTLAPSPTASNRCRRSASGVLWFGLWPESRSEGHSTGDEGDKRDGNHVAGPRGGLEPAGVAEHHGMDACNSLAWLCLVWLVAWALPSPAASQHADWIEPMKQVHARFTGNRGTLALFGDSITVSLAFWAPLEWEPKAMNPAMAHAHQRVKSFMKSECWRQWRGPAFGNEGRMTIRWAHANVDRWLQELNPEVAMIMFGSNDVGELDAMEYEQKTREVVRSCLTNGTVVLLTTMPPRSGRLEKSKQFAEAVRKVAREERVPLVDYFAAILERRPDDWDGALPQFKQVPGDEYQVPTLIARDGVHPSNPRQFSDYSDASLRQNGFALRNYLTLLTYAALIENVLQPAK
jgi:hypothetical protein